ncbi:ornithine carbamoyltransferase [Candidatus Spongiihabitans sp.]|uniref:ornithine carbamoyltransferase n=1 Tax=Candidatus Spongiihabitans sp. TaxID=3101308 RepID=UPI003C6F9DDE
MSIRHFLSLMDLTTAEIRLIISRAIELKAELRLGTFSTLMQNQSAVLVFEKSSTRTRVSFETGVTQFSGNSIFLAPSDSHLGRGEPIEDTAQVLSRMASLIVMRTGPHERIEKMAQYATVPVINGLSDFNHPCQLLADIQTFTEHRGDIRGRKAAWIGDGNNVCHSWMNAARQLDFELHIATPKDHRPDQNLIKDCSNNIVLTEDPKAAAKDAALVVTDTWSGMGHEKEKETREKIFEGYCVDENLMSVAAKNALFMHCLPAYRGSEVTAGVIDGAQSVIWDEAENRLHAQKALMEFLLTNSHDKQL